MLISGLCMMVGVGLANGFASAAPFIPSDINSAGWPFSAIYPSGCTVMVWLNSGVKVKADLNDVSFCGSGKADGVLPPELDSAHRPLFRISWCPPPPEIPCGGGPRLRGCGNH